MRSLERAHVISADLAAPGLSSESQVSCTCSIILLLRSYCPQLFRKVDALFKLLLGGIAEVALSPIVLVLSAASPTAKRYNGMAMVRDHRADANTYVTSSPSGSYFVFALLRYRPR